MDKHAWNFKDLTGLRFGRVVVLEENDMSDNRTTIWRCRCDCGVEFNTLGTNLTRGITRSCGCLRSEATAERNRRLKTGTKYHKKPNKPVKDYDKEC